MSVPPRPVDGGGWAHVDVVPDDRQLLELLARDATDAEDLAARAQECRLPVTPYRSGPAAWSWAPPVVARSRELDPGDVRVLDLTAMWAGPLATAQLAAWGASVTTVEPPFRPDGLRRSPRQFAALDVGKRRVSWDLRVPVDRARFEDAVGAADVLVESFSSRVMANLGYPREVLHRINPGVALVSVRAFPPSSAEASWVAFGRGVHAASGLGIVEGRPAPAQLAYPDALAGLLTFGAVLDAIAGEPPATIEVSLAAAVAPLLPTAGRPLAAADPATVDRLRVATGGRPGGVIVAA
jgi:crotonobetainyl-CoA:carnitine CoA-transferase CaiB-like acyl-CoA transferase